MMPVDPAFTFLVLDPRSEITDELAQAFARELPDVDVVVADSRESALDVVGRALAAFGTIEPDVLAAAPDLAWLQCPLAAPPDGYFYPALVDHPVIVTNMSGIYSDAISTHILAYILAFARGLPIYQRRQLKHDWNRIDVPPTTELANATVLIVGVGGIGSETARLCAALGMRVLGVDPRRTQPPDGMESVSSTSELDALLPQADFVVVTVPHTPRTVHLFNADRFALMKPTCYFINVGRGATTQLGALTSALQAGALRGAALDVYEIEPLPADDPLWDIPNVILTPHVAWAGAPVASRRVQVTIDNARRFATGEPLQNVVNKAEWY